MFFMTEQPSTMTPAAQNALERMTGPKEICYEFFLNTEECYSMKVSTYYLSRTSFQHKNGKIRCAQIKNYSSLGVYIGAYEMVGGILQETILKNKTRKSGNDKEPLRHANPGSFQATHVVSFFYIDLELVFKKLLQTDKTAL